MEAEARRRNEEQEASAQVVQAQATRATEAEAEVAKLRGRAEASERRGQALDREIKELRAQQAQQASSGSEMAERLQEAEARLHRAEADLAAAKGEAEEAVRRQKAAAQEESQRALAERKELEAQVAAARRSATEAKETEATAVKQRDEARRKAAELETQTKALGEQLRQARNEAQVHLLEVQRAREALAAAEASVKDLRAFAEASTAESERLRAQAASAAAAEARAEAAEAGAVRSNALAAEVDELRLNLAEAKSSARASLEKLRLAGEERNQLQASLKEAQAARDVAERLFQEVQGDAEGFKKRAKQALDEARQSIRVMVTAPKVAINVGGNGVDVTTPFPFSAIKAAVQNDVMPKFASVMAVAEGVGDTEIRQGVQQMVEQLALTLQEKVCELLPSAEGTCNWDGFGAKCGRLGTKG